MNAETSGALPLLINATYLVAAMLFILGLKRLSSPRTARGGNMLGAVAMLIAVVVTLLHWEIISFTWIVVGIVIGAGTGAVLARTVKMTDMPQMVALLNGFGGGASALVAGDEYLRFGAGMTLGVDVQATLMLSVIIGALTFSGSLIAFGKLQELITGRTVVLPGQKLWATVLFLGMFGLGAYLVASPANMTLYIALNVLALIMGIFFVMPIGGADMPVVISLLNSYSGLAASMTGFVLKNNVLIIAGALVGASGLILTKIMCDAMNRSLTNVLFGAFAGQMMGGGGAAAGGESKPVRSVSAQDTALLLAYARNVIFVPGYGLAVSQAQHQVREIADLLEAKGVDVKYAVHPVAGRMPGHMNVLLAEANVPYPQLFEMEQINPEFEHTDVVVVIGANDVVNPAARYDKDSPIYGMPILDVDKSQTVVVLKRSMNVGFAGITNELFHNENTRMLFGDARKSLLAVIQELKSGV
jgi:NAD(P) transhydrogenase subunit beta